MVNHITQPINWGDLLRDTMHLSTTAFGAYMRLIGHYWSHGKLPEDDKSLQRITGLHDHRMWLLHKPILQAFFQDGWKHKRIIEDLEKHRQFRDQQREKAAQRWSQGNTVGSVANPLKSMNVGDAAASVRHSGEKSPTNSVPRNSVGTALNPLKSNGAGDATALPTLPLKKDIENLSSVEKSRAREAARQPGPHWAHVDSPQYRAWQKYREALGLGTPIDNRFGWNFPAEWPPS